MNSAHTHFRGLIFQSWPFLFLLVIWFFFASPYFLKGLIPYPSTYQVNNYHPWSAYSQFWGPIKNAAMPDVVGQIYPWKHFTISTLKQNQIPLWNPNSFAGNPHLANFQSAVLSPFNGLFFILPFVDAWAMLILLQPLLAGIFTYIFVRSLSVGKTGSLISSIAFMFCGFIVVWMAYGTLVMAITFLPLALFSIEKYCNTKKYRYLFLLIFSIPLSFFSGHFQMSLYFLITTVAYAFYRSFVTKKPYAMRYLPAIGYRLSRFQAGTLVAMLVGLLLSLPQILPSIEFFHNSIRGEIFIAWTGIPFYYFTTLFAPDFFGNPVTRNDWHGFYAELASFVGIIPLMLAFFAILSKKKGVIFFFSIFTLIVFFLAVDSPVQKIINLLAIPVISTSNPTRMVVLLSFSLAVLSGFGFDRLRNLLQRKSAKKILIPIFFLGFILISIWCILLSGRILPDDKSIIAERNLLLPTLFFGGSVLVILLAFVHKKFLLPVTCYLLLVTSFDSLRFASKWVPFDPRNFIYQDLPVIDSIKKNISYTRLFGNIDQNIGNYYSFQMIEGYDPLYIKRYGEFIMAASTGNPAKAERSVAHLDKTGKYTDRVLDFLGVSILFHRIQDTDTSYAYPVWKKQQKYSLLFQDKKFQVYKNNTAMQRAKLFYTYEVIKDKNTILKRFYNENFNYRDTLLLEENPEDAIKEKGEGYAIILSYSPNKIIITVNSNKPALLLLTDNFYPGWRVTIGGKKKKMYRADYAFRAVAVPVGKSTVEFTYGNFF